MKYDQAFSSFSTSDIDKARQFYAEVLGLKVTDMIMPDDYTLLQLDLDGTRVMIYPKENHEPATFTVLNFNVTDIVSAVKELASRGVVFEKYEEEYIRTDDMGIASGGGTKNAWFKDPAGNILALIEEE